MRTVRRLLVTLAIVLVLGGAIGAMTMWDLGWRAFIMHTGSMTPALPSGDLVIDQPVHSVKVGQVITFAKAPGQYTTHRAAALTPSGIKTKGDANPTDDYGYVTPSEVVGHVVLAIPYGGYVARFFAQPTGAASLVLFLFSLWLAWGLFFPGAEPTRRRPAMPELAVPAPQLLGQALPGPGTIVPDHFVIAGVPSSPRTRQGAGSGTSRRSWVRRRPAHRRRRTFPLSRS